MSPSLPPAVKSEERLAVNCPKCGEPLYALLSWPRDCLGHFKKRETVYCKKCDLKPLTKAAQKFHDSLAKTGMHVESAGRDEKGRAKIVINVERSR